MTRTEKDELMASSGYALFTDASLNPQQKYGVGAYLAVPLSYLELPPDNIDRTEIAARLVRRSVADTSSTKLEVQTVIWALEEYQQGLQRPKSGKLRVYTDSQAVAGLLERRVALEGRGFLSQRTGQLLAHADLYRCFYALADALCFEVIKVAGHSRTQTHDTVQRIFSCVDREVRKALQYQSTIKGGLSP